MTTYVPDEVTWMDPDPQPDIFSGPVRDGEALDGGQEVERHRRDLTGVLRPVGHRQAGHDHVSVADSFDLGIQSRMIQVTVLRSIIILEAVCSENIWNTDCTMSLIPNGILIQSIVGKIVAQRLQKITGHKRKFEILFCIFTASEKWCSFAY